MKNQAVVLLVVAVGCGLVAMLGVKQAISQKTVEPEETIQVLQVIDDIAPGTPLDEINTQFVNVPVSAVPEGAVRTKEEYEERALTIPAVPGDWILKSKLGEKGQFGAVNNIPPGMVVVTIPVDATQSHSGMLRPGNRIDLLLTYADATAGISIQKAITVLEFVEVFAVDNRVAGTNKDGDAEAKNITLLVTPEQGKAVTLARRIEGGTLSTLMRGKPVANSNTQAEISQDFLTSSFMRSNKNAPSVMDLREDHESNSSEEQSLSDPEMTSSRAIVDAEMEEDLPSLDELLDQEISSKHDPGGSGPVPMTVEAPKNTWTMRIYEGENLRVESVEIADTGDTKSSDGSDWSVWNLFKTK
ncbi:MAG: Flp pilus assembly protein CpaB [Planctomycetota bacterium]